MRSLHSVLSDIENKIGSKTYLEFAVLILDSGFFNPVVYSHDSGWFDKKRYSQVVIGFINLLSFFYSCGITLDTEAYAPVDEEIELYRNIMRDEDMSESIVCYELLESDFTGLSIQNASVPENCTEADFALVKIYLYLRTGAALSRKSVENILGDRLTDSEMIVLRKQLENITGRKLKKRKDNSYEMR